MFALQIQPDGGPYEDRFEIAADLADIVNAELHRSIDAATGNQSSGGSSGGSPSEGWAAAAIVQLDDPSFSFHRSGADGAAPVDQGFPQWGPHALAEAAPPPARELAQLYNRVVRGLRQRGAKLLLHLCFGNFQGRPRTARSYHSLFPGILEARCDQFVLEFAGREMAEADLWPEFGVDRELGAGVVDVKSFYPDTPAQVAGRIRRLLQHVPAERLWLNPDCGLNHSARWVAAAKLRAMVVGTRIVRAELGCPDRS